jgi:hypothetical protein
MKILKYVAFVGILFLASCDEEPAEVKLITAAKTIRYTSPQLKNKEVDIDEYTIDSCQYIGDLSSSDARSYYLTHKGNCTNSIHTKK